jgi:hypothetical protein
MLNIDKLNKCSHRFKKISVRIVTCAVKTTTHKHFFVNNKQSIFYYVCIFVFKFSMCGTFTFVELSYDTFIFFTDGILFFMLEYYFNIFLFYD